MIPFSACDVLFRIEFVLSMTLFRLTIGNADSDSFKKYDITQTQCVAGGGYL